MGNMQTGYSDFDVYIVASEPHKQEQAEAWKWPSACRRLTGSKTTAAVS